MHKPLVMSRKQLVQREKYHRTKHAHYKCECERLAEENESLKKALASTRRAHLDDLNYFLAFLKRDRAAWLVLAFVSAFALGFAIVDFFF